MKLMLAGLLALPAFGSDFVPGCRVKADTLVKHGSLTHNGTCVLTREVGGELQFLLGYAGNSKQVGWGFPGGKALTTDFDSNLNPKTGKPFSPESFEAAKNIPYDYAEPAFCAAGRETKEETGVDVVVGDLIKTTVTVAAFRCHVLFPDQLKEPLQSHDPAEIQQVGWFTLKEMRAPGFLRFASDLTIAASVRP